MHGHMHLGTQVFDTDTPLGLLPISNSDHLNHQSVPCCKCNKCTVWRYGKGDFARVADDWNSLMCDCVDTSWKNWKSKFPNIVTRAIPYKTLCPPNIPWLNLAILKKIQKRNTLYHKATISGCCHSRRKYKALRNQVMKKLEFPSYRISCACLKHLPLIQTSSGIYFILSNNLPVLSQLSAMVVPVHPLMQKKAT